MSSWAQRVHRRAANIGSVVTSCSTTPPYCYRLEKVKFGVPLAEVCKNDDIPAPLLVLILKLDKDALYRRNVFRAPGNLGAMEKLIHFLQAGRLINVDNYSVYTIASVLKQFLRNIPQGVFGRDGEKELFAIIGLTDEREQTTRLHNLFTSLPKYTQQLLVLLFGTFHVIASNATVYGTGMTSEALGISVAPSFIQSCTSDGKTASMKDVDKYKLAPKIMQHIIDKFVTQDIFGRENYEYYVRITGRVLKVEEDWIFNQYPAPPRDKLAQQRYAIQHSLEPGKTWLQCQCERWGLLAQEESRSTPALLTSSSSALDNGVVSLGVTSEHSLLESCARLSVSLEGPGLFAMNSSSPLAASRRHTSDIADDDDHDYDEDEYEDENDLDNYDGNCGYAKINDTNIIESDNKCKNNENNKTDSNRRYHENQENYHRNYNLLTRSSNVCTRKKKFMRKMKNDSSNLMAKGNYESPVGKSREALGDLSLDEECDDTEIARLGRRRFRQNKKKISNNSSAQLRVQLQQQQKQQQRRYRSNYPIDCKSLDSNEHCIIKADKNDRHHYKADFKNNAGDTPATETVRTKGRYCNLCRRGLRHSSSCSSTTNTTPSSSSSGTNTNPNGDNNTMTMEELRAVNRYAESTKSLSYLPQVHERQTARMRTRSEWFLGPKVVDLLYCTNVGNTCSNCCLQHQQHQKQQREQQQQEKQEEDHQKLQLQLQLPISYLGGGSTRDMRHSEIHAMETMDTVNTSLFIYYKQQQQLQEQQRIIRQSFHSALENMDTDDGIALNSANTSLTQTHSMEKQHTTIGNTLRLGKITGGRNEVETTSMLLDANYGRYNFLIDDIERQYKKSPTSTIYSSATTTTTTTTTTTATLNIITNDHNHNNDDSCNEESYHTDNYRHINTSQHVQNTLLQCSTKGGQQSTSPSLTSIRSYHYQLNNSINNNNNYNNNNNNNNNQFNRRYYNNGHDVRQQDQTCSLLSSLSTTTYHNSSICKNSKRYNIEEDVQNDCNYKLKANHEQALLKYCEKEQEQEQKQIQVTENLMNSNSSYNHFYSSCINNDNNTNNNLLMGQSKNVVEKSYNLSNTICHSTPIKHDRLSFHSSTLSLYHSLTANSEIPTENSHAYSVNYDQHTENEIDGNFVVDTSSTIATTTTITQSDAVTASHNHNHNNNNNNNNNNATVRLIFNVLDFLF